MRKDPRAGGDSPLTSTLRRRRPSSWANHDGPIFAAAVDPAEWPAWTDRVRFTVAPAPEPEGGRA